MNIAFFGASVTAQKNGYVDKFKDLCTDNQFNITKNGYIGMHIRDAGITFIDKVIEQTPKFCFLDWFSTAYIINNTIFMDTIIHKLTLIKSIPIFLFMYRTDHDKRLSMYNYCKNYADNHNIPYIELYNYIDDKNIILKDEVHTNEIGSQSYAEIIYEKFTKILQTSNEYSIIQPPKNKFYTFNFKQINKKVYNNIHFKGNGLIIGIYQIVGHHSGLLEYIIPNNQNKTVCLWDRHCYYNRQHFQNCHLNINESLIIKVLQTNSFDRTAYKGDFDWTLYSKFMDVDTIYYLGDIEINIDDE